MRSLGTFIFVLVVVIATIMGILIIAGCKNAESQTPVVHPPKLPPRFIVDSSPVGLTIITDSATGVQYMVVDKRNAIIKLEGTPLEKKPESNQAESE